MKEEEIVQLKPIKKQTTGLNHIFPGLLQVHMVSKSKLVGIVCSVCLPVAHPTVKALKDERVVVKL